MFREMIRKDRQLSDIKTTEILAKGNMGVLATLSNNGYPYATPLNYSYSGENIYFHCAPEGHMIDNIEYNHKVSFCITSDVELRTNRLGVKYKSVVVFGKASEVFDPEKEEALIALIKQCYGQFSEKDEKFIQSSKNKTRIFKIEIEHVTGKSNIKF